MGFIKKRKEKKIKNRREDKKGFLRGLISRRKEKERNWFCLKSFFFFFEKVDKRFDLF